VTTVAKPSVKAEYERHRIIEHAAGVFLERGYDGTTMDHIARAMQVTKGFIYYYFTSKGEVFYELHSKAIREAHAFVVSHIPPGADPVTRLRRAVAAHIQLTTQRPAFRGVALRTAWITTSRNFPAQYRRQLAGQRDSLRAVYEEIIRDGVEAGIFRPVEASVVIKMAMGALTWMPTWYRPDGRLGPEVIAEILTDMMLGPLLADAPTRRGRRREEGAS